MHRAALLLLLTLALPALAADAPLTYDRISLAASAEREVANDTQTVLLQAMAEGEDTARLAREVNDAVRWAVTEAKDVEGVEVQTLNYQTRPVYRQQNLVAWRVSHGVRLESRDGALLSRLLGRLQQRLNLESLGYHVSPQARREAEEELTAEALDLFRDRAHQVTAQLERPGYRIVHIDINTNANGGPQPRMRAMALEAAGDHSAPVLEAGKQTIQVNVHGTIELRVE